MLMGKMLLLVSEVSLLQSQSSLPLVPLIDMQSSLPLVPSLTCKSHRLHLLSLQTCSYPSTYGWKIFHFHHLIFIHLLFLPQPTSAIISRCNESIFYFIGSLSSHTYYLILLHRFKVFPTVFIFVLFLSWFRSAASNVCV